MRHKGPRGKTPSLPRIRAPLTQVRSTAGRARAAELGGRGAGEGPAPLTTSPTWPGRSPPPPRRQARGASSLGGLGRQADPRRVADLGKFLRSSAAMRRVTRSGPRPSRPRETRRPSGRGAGEPTPAASSGEAPRRPAPAPQLARSSLLSVTVRESVRLQLRGRSRDAPRRGAGAAAAI